MFRYIDLFAGMGGIRLGLEQALKEKDMQGECVLTSEIKPHALRVYKDNFGEDNIVGDIIVKDKDVINKIVNKELKELSLGYKQDLYYDESTKLYSFKNIIYNHLALVKKGRAGNAMILDSQDELVLEEEIVNDSTEEVKEVEVETKDETLEVKEEETKDSCVEDTKEEVVETSVPTTDVEETKEEPVVEDAKDEEPVVENKEELTQDSEEIINKKGEEQIVKDINYFLERQKEIANIKDENLKKKMSLILDSEMEEVLGKTETKQPDIVVVDGGEPVVTKTYEQEMQEYYDKFNPNNYDSPKDAIDFYKKESNYRPKYIRK